MGTSDATSGRRHHLPAQDPATLPVQPAEEGVPEGEQGGASLMLAEGLLDVARPEAIFGLHVVASMHAGYLGYRPGPFMAGSDFFKIVVTGKQTHGARPWDGVDPIVVAAQIVIGLQTVAEDFAYYGREIPSLFFWVGISPPDADLPTTPTNHSPLFNVDESGLLTGLRAMLGVAVDYLEHGPSGKVASQ